MQQTLQSVLYFLHRLPARVNAPENDVGLTTSLGWTFWSSMSGARMGVGRRG